MKRGKKYADAKVKVDNTRPTPVNDAVKLAKDLSFAKFDESVELHFSTTADPRHADQQMREIAELPHGTGAQVRVMVFAEGDAARTAEEAGADFIADGDIIKRIVGGWSDFDVSIATPDQMGKIGRLGRYLGRKGLMPNPRTGTVVQAQDIPRAIASAKKGRAEVRLDRTANIHTRIGKVSFSDDQLIEKPRQRVQDRGEWEAKWSEGPVPHHRDRDDNHGTRHPNGPGKPGSFGQPGLN